MSQQNLNIPAPSPQKDLCTTVENQHLLRSPWKASTMASYTLLDGDQTRCAQELDSFVKCGLTFSRLKTAASEGNRKHKYSPEVDLPSMGDEASEMVARMAWELWQWYWRRESQLEKFYMAIPGTDSIVDGDRVRKAAYILCIAVYDSWRRHINRSHDDHNETLYRLYTSDFSATVACSYISNNEKGLYLSRRV